MKRLVISSLSLGIIVMHFLTLHWYIYVNCETVRGGYYEIVGFPLPSIAYDSGKFQCPPSTKEKSITIGFYIIDILCYGLILFGLIKIIKNFGGILTKNILFYTMILVSLFFIYIDFVYFSKQEQVPWCNTYKITDWGKTIHIGLSQ